MLPCHSVTDISAVIFDYYETLAQISRATREETFDALARKVSVSLPPGEAYRQWVEFTTKDHEMRFGGHRRSPLEGPTPPFITFLEVWEQRSADLFGHWGVDAPAQVGVDAYMAAHGRAPVYPEVPGALAALHEHYRLAVLSDADAAFIEPSIEHNGLEFELVLTSEDVRAYKPHVSLFHDACGRLGVTPSQAVYVGDTPWQDVEGARNAGMQTVWVNRHGASWPDDIEPPPAVVTSLAELPSVLGI